MKNHETTLILVKPDAVEEGLTGEVLHRLEKNGLKILNCRMLRLDGPLLKEHYAHLASLPFFPEIEKFMSSGPVVAVALAGESAISKVRDLLGPTDSTKAPKGTIRGDLGKEKMHNVLHASDAAEKAQAELRRFFGWSDPMVSPALEEIFRGRGGFRSSASPQRPLPPRRHPPGGGHFQFLELGEFQRQGSVSFFRTGPKRVYRVQQDRWRQGEAPGCRSSWHQIPSPRQI